VPEVVIVDGRDAGRLRAALAGGDGAADSTTRVV